MAFVGLGSKKSDRARNIVGGLMLGTVAYSIGREHGAQDTTKLPPVASGPVAVLQGSPSAVSIKQPIVTAKNVPMIQDIQLRTGTAAEDLLATSTGLVPVQGSVNSFFGTVNQKFPWIWAVLGFGTALMFNLSRKKGRR